MKVGILGAGAWGTTVAALAVKQATTVLWAREAEVVESIRSARENQPFLAGFRLPAALEVTQDVDAAVSGADVVVVAVPSQHLRAVVASAAAFLSADALVVSLAKGLEEGSCLRMSEVIAAELPGHPPAAIGCLAGPNLAREVMAGNPSATCAAFSDLERAEAVQQLFMSDTLRVYTSDDVIGCEIGGAVKNVIAIAAGVADGLGYGMNTLAALITRGLAELTRLGVALGGHPLTFLGLAGNGDLIATCGSPKSRNRRVGEELAKGRSIAEIIGERRSVAEGVDTAPVVCDLAGRVGVEMPISATVAALLAGELAPADIVPRLMRREPKFELHGLGVERRGR